MRALTLTLAVLCACSSKPRPPPCSLDVQTDSQNCGECGNVCQGGTRCEDGVCVSTCAGLRCLAGVCVDPLTDPNHCGACGARCAAQHATPLCIAGSCTRSECEPGWYDCDGDVRNGCENDDLACRVDICGARENGFPHNCQPLAVSADGRRIVFMSGDGDYVPGDVGFTYDAFLLEVSTRQVRRLSVRSDGEPPNPQADVASCALSGDGTRVAFWHRSRLTLDDRDSSEDVHLLDLETGQLSRVIQPDFADAGVTLFPSSMSLTHDGRRIAWGVGAAQDTYSYVADVPGGAPSTHVNFGAPVLSPDGTRLGLVLLDDAGVALEPWVLDLDAGTKTRLLERRRSVAPVGSGLLTPVFSFDGRVKAFSTNQRGFSPADDAGFFTTEQVFVLGEDGGVLRAFQGTHPLLSYDGHRVAFTENGNFARGCRVFDFRLGRFVFEETGASECLALAGDGRSVVVGNSGLSGYLQWLSP